MGDPLTLSLPSLGPDPEQSGSGPETVSPLRGGRPQGLATLA